MSKAKTEFNVSQINGNSNFQPFSCWRKKTNKQERPQIVFLYDSHDINCYFSCKKYLENKSFFARFHVSAGGMYAIFNKTPAFVIF